MDIVQQKLAALRAKAAALQERAVVLEQFVDIQQQIIDLIDQPPQAVDQPPQVVVQPPQAIAPALEVVIDPLQVADQQPKKGKRRAEGDLPEAPAAKRQVVGFTRGGLRSALSNVKSSDEMLDALKAMLGDLSVSEFARTRFERTTIFEYACDMDSKHVSVLYDGIKDNLSHAERIAYAGWLLTALNSTRKVPKHLVPSVIVQLEGIMHHLHPRMFIDILFPNLRSKTEVPLGVAIDRIRSVEGLAPIVLRGLFESNPDSTYRPQADCGVTLPTAYTVIGELAAKHTPAEQFCDWIKSAMYESASNRARFLECRKLDFTYCAVKGGSPGTYVELMKIE